MIAFSADVDDSATIGDGSFVWHLAQIREQATIGAECNVGRGVYIGSGVVIGDRVKVQNYALVYEPAVIGGRCLHRPRRGPHERTPSRARSIPTAARKTASNWESVGVSIGDGSSIGARSVCVAPVPHWRVGPGCRRLGGHPRRARPRTGRRNSGTPIGWWVAPVVACASMSSGVDVPGHRLPLLPERRLPDVIRTETP